MKVESVHSVIGWFQDRLRLETRRTYHYDQGSSVTVIERRSIAVQLYNKQGEILDPAPVGSKIDLRS